MLPENGFEKKEKPVKSQVDDSNTQVGLRTNLDHADFIIATKDKEMAETICERISKGLNNLGLVSLISTVE